MEETFYDEYVARMYREMQRKVVEIDDISDEDREGLLRSLQGNRKSPYETYMEVAKRDLSKDNLLLYEHSLRNLGIQPVQNPETFDLSPD